MTREEAPEKMTLQEIRQAYGEILRAFNTLYPLHPATRKEPQDITDNFDKGDESLIEAIRTKARKIFPKLKGTADQSGNVKVWHRGDPLEGLNRGMRERIEKALKLGI